MRRVLWAALLTTLAAACQEAPAPPGKPLVVASFYPMYEFSRQVAGDRAEVVSLVPPGVEPHDWEPSPQKLVEVQSARLLVYNGAGFEPWVDKLLHDVTGKKIIVIETTTPPWASIHCAIRAPPLETIPVTRWAVSGMYSRRMPACRVM